MIKLGQSLLVIAFLALAVAAQTAAKIDFDERRIVRLAPSDFKTLPLAVANYLNEKKCAVPQNVLVKEPHNVLQGEFFERGQTDWAVLCSRDGASAILVFRAGRTELISELGKSPDTAFIGAASKEGSVGFLRQIKIVKMSSAEGGASPQFNQQGIEDAFLEKTANIFYFFGQRWVRLNDAY